MVTKQHRKIAYYRTAAGVEIDFIVETRKRLSGNSPEVVCIEVKMADKWSRKWERAMRDLASSTGVNVSRMIAMYTGSEELHFNGLDVLPVAAFLKQLHTGQIF